MVNPDEQVVLVTGDTVFKRGVLEKFCELSQKSRAGVVAGLRPNEGLKPYPAISAVSFPGKLFDELTTNNLNLEDVLAMAVFGIRQAIQNGLKLTHMPVAANLNTPADYKRALGMYEGY